MSDSISPKKKIELYQQQFDEDCQVDQITMMDKLEQHPVIVNKWLKIYYDNRYIYNDLVHMRDELFAEYRVELETSDDPRYRGLSQAAMKRKIESSTKIVKVDKLIKEQSILVEFLKDVVGVAKFSLMDSCKGIIEIRKLEEM